MAPILTQGEAAKLSKENNQSVIAAASGKLVEADEIRLLELYPGHVESLLEGRIFKTSLSKKPLYTALSYSCGPTADYAGGIKLKNAGIFGLGYNLNEALVGLRNNTKIRTLWIDAICIDQSDVEERGSQVQMMGTIFSTASHVIAWMQCGVKCYRGFATSVPDDDPCSAIEGIHQHALQTSTSRFARTDPSLSRIARFFADAYWTRRWIVQELCLARMITFESNNQSITMGSIDRFIEGFDDEKWGLGLSETMAARVLVYRRGRARERVDLYETLSSYDDTQCSDPLDKVYALLSLASRAKLHLVVNYRLTPKELLFEVLEYCWKSQVVISRTSDFLSMGCMLRKALDLKSHDLDVVSESSSSASAFWPKRVSLFERGTVDADNFSVDFEEMVRNGKDHLPSLQNYKPFSISKKKATTTRGVSRSTQITWQLEDLLPGTNETAGSSFAAVSGLDLRPFCYSSAPAHEVLVGKNRREGRPRVSKLGLASIHVEQGDQILQFINTPVALIARETDQGAHRIIGRAFLMRETSFPPNSNRELCHHRVVLPHFRLKSLLDHGFDETDYCYDLELHALELLQILKWTSLDT